MKMVLLVSMIIAFSANAGTAFFKYERPAGMNKICIYDHLGSEHAITVGALSFCPLTISV